MFNLLMFDVDWNQPNNTVPAERALEYTDVDVLQQFQGDDGRLLLDQLTRLPCLFCGEGTADELVYVGQIVQARQVRNEIVISPVIDRSIPPLRNSMLYENRAELGMPREFEFSRNHWAVKNVDLYRFLYRNAIPRRPQPTAFQIHEHEAIDPALASAMMPFDAAFDDVYATIREASEAAGLRCNRADDIWEHQTIIQDVVSLINRSRIVVCDCTRRNPNVFYEIGIAHTLGREVILITQNPHDIPFDIQQFRYIHYLNNAEGRTRLAEALANRMQTIIAR